MYAFVFRNLVMSERFGGDSDELGNTPSFRGTARTDVVLNVIIQCDILAKWESAQNAQRVSMDRKLALSLRRAVRSRAAALTGKGEPDSSSPLVTGLGRFCSMHLGVVQDCGEAGYKVNQTFTHTQRFAAVV